MKPVDLILLNTRQTIPQRLSFKPKSRSKMRLPRPTDLTGDYTEFGASFSKLATIGCPLLFV